MDASVWSVDATAWERGRQRLDKHVRHVQKIVGLGGVAVLLIALGFRILLSNVTPTAASHLTRSWGGTAVGAVALALSAALWLRELRRAKRARDVFTRARDCGGCVCPFCGEDITKSACVRHGLSRAQQPLLIRYYEAVAEGDRIEIAQAWLALDKETERSWMRRRASAVERCGVAASIPGSTLPTLLFAMLLEAGRAALFCATIFSAVGGSFNGMTIMMFWPAIGAALVGPIAIRSLRMTSLRCSKCKQLCATPRGAICPECGSDLTKFENTTRAPVFSWRPILWLLGAVMLPGICMSSSLLIKFLPTSAQLTIASWTHRAPPMFFNDLSRTKLTPTETLSAAKTLIEIARETLDKEVYAFDFLAHNLATGVLPASIAEDAARATVEPTLSLTVQDASVDALVEVHFGSNLFGSNLRQRFVFGGCNVDDGAWTPSAHWSIDGSDLDPFWRANSAGVLPIEQTTFKATLPLSAGRHTIKARGWIVVVGHPWHRYEPTFNSNDTLITPATALGAYPIELSKEVDISSKAPK